MAVEGVAPVDADLMEAGEALGGGVEMAPKLADIWRPAAGPD